MSKKHRKNLTVRIGDDEREHLEKFADEAGVSLTRYIRKVALAELPQTNRKLKGGTLTDKDFIEAFQELIKIGTNLNQIAKRLHLQHAKRKAQGEEDIDLSEYPLEEITIFIEIFDNVDEKLSQMKHVIMEVV